MVVFGILRHINLNIQCNIHKNSIFDYSRRTNNMYHKNKVQFKLSKK